MSNEINTEVVNANAKVLVHKPAVFGAAAVATVVGIVAFAMSIRSRGRIEVIDTQN